jgi:hypothetical protein
VWAADTSGTKIVSKVVFIPHKKNDIAAQFSHITTRTADVKMTPNHVILAGDCSAVSLSLPLVYASQVGHDRADVTLSLLNARTG